VSTFLAQRTATGWLAIVGTLPTPPKVNIGPKASITTTVKDLTVSVDGTQSTDADGTVKSWAWTFGDGATATGPTAQHTYAKAGSYPIGLTVTDDDGALGVAVPKLVTVSAPVTPPSQPSSFVLGTTKPSASNTGVGVLRPAPTSSSTTTMAALTTSTTQTITAKRITGNLVVNGGTVTVKDSIIDGFVKVNGGTANLENCEIRMSVKPTTDTWGLYTGTGGTAKLEFCTIHSTNPSIYVAGGVGAKNITVRRCNIYDVMDGIDVYNVTSASGALNTIVEGNYIHDLLYLTGETRQPDGVTHCDGIQFQGGSGGSIVGNYISASASTKYSTAPKFKDGSHPQALSCLMLTPNVGPISDLVVSKNWFDGGEIDINGGALDRKTGNTGTIAGNRFGRNQYYPGHTIDLDATAQGKFAVTGNVYEDNGATVQIRWNA